MPGTGLSTAEKTAGALVCRTSCLPPLISKSTFMNDKLLQILADTLGADPVTLSEQTSIENTPAWDSVAHLNLVLSLEQAFGQKFTPEEFMQMQSVEAIQRALAAHGVS